MEQTVKKLGKTCSAKKIVFIVAYLVETPEAYEGKSNAELETEILTEMPQIPYVATIEKVTVLEAT